MKSLESYISEGLFSKSVAAGEGPGVIKKISNMQKIDIPKTAEEYIDYISAWAGLLYRFIGVCSYELQPDMVKVATDAYYGHLADFHLELTEKECKDILFDAVNLDAIPLHGYYSHWDEMLVKPGMQTQTKLDAIQPTQMGAVFASVVKTILGIDNLTPEQSNCILFLLSGRCQCLLKGNKYIIDSHASRAKSKRRLEKYIHDISHYVADSLEMMSDNPEAKEHAANIRTIKKI